MNLQKVLFLPKNILKCNLHTSAAMNKIQAGRYKVTRDRSKPLTYEQSFWPEQIAIKKGTYMIKNSDAGTGGARGAPQYLTDQLSLFEPGRTDYPHLLLLAPPMFFTFWHHWLLNFPEKVRVMTGSRGQC